MSLSETKVDGGSTIRGFFAESLIDEITIT